MNNIRISNIINYKKTNQKNNMFVIKTAVSVTKLYMREWCNNFFSDNKVIKINSITRKKKRRTTFFINSSKKYIGSKIKTNNYKIFMIKFFKPIDLKLRNKFINNNS